MNSVKLDYIPSSQKYQCLSSLLNRDWAMLLDSGELTPQDKKSAASLYRRYDIFVCDPSAKVTLSEYTLEITDKKQTHRIRTKEPLIELRKLLARYAVNRTTDKIDSSIPFNGGLIGYLSYDFGKEFLAEQHLPNPNRTKNKAIDDLQIPFIQMGLYQWALITDHCCGTSRLYNFGLSQKEWNEIIDKVSIGIKSANTSSKTNLANTVSKFASNTTFEQYSSAFKQIKDYIVSGDCYQVNYAQRFCAEYTGPTSLIYQKLAVANNSPFGAYLNFKDHQILSLSPERFISANGKKIITQPIKGTMPRSTDPKIDKQRADRLKNSEKDLAENLMIVDLLRNDLSRTAAKGSVKVTELFGHYRFESVHHLISTIESELASQFDVFDLLTTTLPGGSITGAPKIRAMQIIDELEPVKRGIYCGIIGYIDFAGNMDSNICIRTLVAKNNKLYCWAGGGLVSDSILESEYQETYDKLNKILPVLNEGSNNYQTSPPHNAGNQCG